MEAPKTIYLQVDGEKYGELEGVTWCVDRINDEDVTYVRQDVAEARAAELEQIIYKIAEQAYQNEVIDTEMEKSWIGKGKEYADKRDWIDCWMSQWED